jgi:hypothetical protein
MKSKWKIAWPVLGIAANAGDSILFFFMYADCFQTEHDKMEMNSDMPG